MLKAYVNHGRWVIDCPFCAGAELARADGMFYCGSCQMKANKNKPLPVKLPDERELVEAVLSVRRAENRNWRPGETVEALVQENKEHGL